ncbi:RNA polymerase sigma factor [Myceligenerans indicum]|uniref:Sigma-70 family RNA polymerase sigma factor n=1 Tax=Myceligenerans indicum TaxID=2593663 RepID=A0ABS1LNB8_9MICO|nr:sigma-70 family RNA polymerase sigma factor [Myceligenerans indicum]MBL0887283.1 sigma-70 family RNA polymerase sigma factor [Myceligenerans indicum]
MTTSRSEPGGRAAADQPPPGEDRLRALWTDHAWRVQAYAMRHVEPHVAQEVVAETFVVAWRKLDAVPAEPLPWLLTVARNVAANHQRANRRRRTAESDAIHLARVTRAAESADVSVEERDALIGGLARLAPKEREALLLTGWDGLTPTDAARVVGCTTAAFKMRLSRARRRLEAYASDGDPGDSGPAATATTPDAPTRRLA